jgi:hypothetical protein
MAFIYIPIQSPELALHLSTMLFELSRPVTIRQYWEVSNRFCGWVSHPTLNLHYMELSTEFHYIYSEADETLLDSILQPFVELGLIGNQDITNIQQAIISNRGKRISVTDFIPPFWLSLQKTREDLEVMGFFFSAMPLLT